MKFTVDIDLDWIGEDTSVDEEIKTLVVAQVAKQIAAKVQPPDAKELIEKADTEIRGMVADAYARLNEKPIVMRDHWNDVKEEYPNLETLIKNRFDRFLTEKVDSGGRVTDYGQTMTRVQYMIEEGFKKHATEFQKKTIAEIENRAKGFLNDALKEAIHGQLAKTLKLDELFTQAPGLLGIEPGK